MWKFIAGGLPGVGWGSITGEVFSKLNRSNSDEVIWVEVEESGTVRELAYKQKRTRLKNVLMGFVGEGKIDEI